jgi:hypothetical protein
MAREMIERLVDDLDGSDAVETVRFGLDGVSYEIDLTEKNAAALRKALEKYARAARKGSGGRSAGRAKASARVSSRHNGRGYDLAQLREWAGTNKVAIPSRGRIPQAVVEQYKGAGGR